jgi:SAM-dependent methyltransferase
MSRSRNEGERLRAVYARYHATGAYAGKWSRANSGNVISGNRFKSDVETILAREIEQLGRARILDAGCGYGHLLGWLVELGAQPRKLFGVDLLKEHVSVGKRTYEDIHFIVGDLRRAPLPDNSFDLIICSTLFSSIIDDDVAFEVGREIRRLLRPSGKVLWYDLRYPNPGNQSVRPYSERMIRELFPDTELTLRTTKLLPPIARNLGPLTRTLYPMLHKVPFLRSHYLGIIRMLAGGECSHDSCT